MLAEEGKTQTKKAGVKEESPGGGNSLRNHSEMGRSRSRAASQQNTVEVGQGSGVGGQKAGYVNKVHTV